ncbi:ArfGAP with FG repeats 1 [Chytriomyces hyalinus]|nr:ArfGAP with FG repeats 1 [Chytriomyces hyalinus]
MSASQLQQIVSRDENKVCMDCPAKMPNNVNITCSTFVCSRCAGLLRTLSHRIKTISGSSFSMMEVAALAKGGNAVARAIYLAKYKQSVYPLPDPNDDAKVLAFIKEKYLHKTWFNADAKTSSSSSSIQLMEPKKIGIIMASTSATSETASDTFKILPPPSFTSSFASSAIQPPKSIRSAAASKNVVHSVDDLFGLDFGANTNVTPAVPSPVIVSSIPSKAATPIHAQSMPNISSRSPSPEKPEAPSNHTKSIVVEPESTETSVNQEFETPSGEKAIYQNDSEKTSEEPQTLADRRRAKILNEGPERLAKISPLHQPKFPSTPMNTPAAAIYKPNAQGDDLFSFDEPIQPESGAAANSTIDNANTTSQPGIMDDIIFGSQDLDPLDVIPLQYTITPKPTQNAVPVVVTPSHNISSTNSANSGAKSDMTDLFTLLSNDLSSTSGVLAPTESSEEGMGSLLGAALSSVHSRASTVTEILVDLKSLDLGAKAPNSIPESESEQIVDIQTSEGVPFGTQETSEILSHDEAATSVSVGGFTADESTWPDSGVSSEIAGGGWGGDALNAGGHSDATNPLKAVSLNLGHVRTEDILFDLEHMMDSDHGNKEDDLQLSVGSRVQADFDGLDVLENPWG